MQLPVLAESSWDPPPQASTQAVLDPALLPLLHSVGLVGGTEHRHTAASEGGGAKLRSSLTVPVLHINVVVHSPGAGFTFFSGTNS